MTKSKIFLFLCLSFILGVAVSSFYTISQPLMLGILILGLILISTLWRYKKIVVIGFCLLFLVFGVYRHQQIILNIPHVEEQNVNFVGLVVEEPDVRETHTKLTLIKTEPRTIEGKVLVTVGRYPEYQYGDKLKITGELQKPQVFADFNYRDYLIKDGIYSVIYFPEIELIEKESFREQFSETYGKILRFKEKLRESIEKNLSPPQSSILAAVLLGDKRKISDEFKEKLNIAGLRHITAISGMHVAILTGILMTAFIGFGFRRKPAFYLTIIIITFFIVMTGLQSSAVRAGIMGGILLLARYLGRVSISSRALVFAAAVMLAMNPLLLRLDVGFQLSFLAVLGIIYLMPYLEKWIKFRILAMTLAAQIFTLPILIYNFGYISSVSPLTNILIVPLLPFIMISGFIFASAGVIWPLLGWLIAWPVWLLLSCVVKIIDTFSQLSFAAVTLEISWPWFLAFYLILGYGIWQLNKNFGKI